MNEITEEMTQALADLRAFAAAIRVEPLVGAKVRKAAQAIDLFDEAGIFRPIDEHTDYDVAPDPVPMIPWNALVYWHLPGEEENNRGRAYLVHARTEHGVIRAAEAAFHQDEGDPARLGGRRRPIIDGIKVSEVRKDPAEWGDTTGYAQ